MRGNTISIIGNITRDADVARTQSGHNAVKWGMAWNSRRKNSQTGDYEDVPHFFDVECWMTDAQLNKVLNDIKKGARIAIVDGHLEYQQWQDNNGNKRSKQIIRVDDPFNGMLVRFNIPSGSNGGYQAPTNNPPQQQQMAPQTAPQQQGYAYGQPQQGGQQAYYNAADSVYDQDIPF